MGYATLFDPDPQRSKGQVSLIENDTTICAHCGRLQKLIYGDPLPWRVGFDQNVKSVNVCKKCVVPGKAFSGVVCAFCTQFACDPVEKKLERLERQAKD